MTITVPLQDSYEATLTQELTGDASALTIYVSEVPVFTFPAGKEVVMTINPTKGFTKQENVLIESYSAVNKTLTVKAAGRAQARYNGDTATVLSHPVGSKIILSDPYPVWNALASTTTSGGVYTGAVSFLSEDADVTFQIPNMSTTERDTIASPANGMLIYNTTDGIMQVYDGGAWTDVETGAPVPNASTTVAGIVEEATAAEVGAATATGGTGARLFINPGSTAKTSSGAADENKLPVLDANGQLATGFIPSTARAANVDSYEFGATIADQEALYIDGDGTAKIASSGDVTTTYSFLGVANAAGVDGETKEVVTSGEKTVPAFNKANGILTAGVSNTTTNATAEVNGNTWKGQTFVPADGQTSVGRVTLDLGVTGTPSTGNYNVLIYAVDGSSLPTGAALGTSANVTAASIASGGAGLYDFDFSTPVDVTPGTTYAIVFRRDATQASNYASWDYNNTSVYANGNGVTSADAGSSWAAEATNDYYFEVYYRAVPGASVFLSTSGDLTITEGSFNKRVGLATGDNSMLVQSHPNMIFASANISVSGTGTVDTELELGFRPRYVRVVASKTGGIQSWGVLDSVSGGGNVSYGAPGYDVDLASGQTGYANYTAGATSILLREDNGVGGAAELATITLQAITATTITLRRNVSTFTSGYTLYYRIIAIG